MDQEEYNKGYQDAIAAIQDIMNGGNGQNQSGQGQNQSGLNGPQSRPGSQSGQGQNQSGQSGQGQNQSGQGGQGGKATENKPGVPSDVFDKAAKEGERRGTRKKGQKKDSGQGGQGGQGEQGGNSSQYNGEKQMTDEEIAQLEDYTSTFVDDTIKKYRNKLSGAFGEFVDKCRVSYDTAGTKKGMVVYSNNGSPHWAKAFKDQVTSYIKQQVIKKHREMMPTYSRPRRGSGLVKWGEPLKPGVKVKEDKLNITIAFYIDRSGSMGGSVDNVFSLAYDLSKMIHKQNAGDKVVGEFDFKYYAFNDYITEIKNINSSGKVCAATGGTMDFKYLLKEILDRTNDYLVNIVITDAGFNVDRGEIMKLLDNLNGLCVFISNSPEMTIEKISKDSRFKNKLYYLLADSDFSLK